MAFRLAPCLVLWDFKTDGWPPVPIPKPSPRPRAPWIELRLALAMLRQWFDGLSAGTLSGFMGIQNWRMAPCPDPKALPVPKSSLDRAAGTKRCRQRQQAAPSLQPSCLWIQLPTMAELSQPNFTWLDGFGTNNPTAAIRKPCYDFSFRPPLKPKRGGRRHQGDSPFYNPATPGQ